jgi:hypothetical protein
MVVNLEVPYPKISSMKEILDEIDEDTIRLPDFQRDFRWKLSDINELLVSMLNGYPIGTFLFWRREEENDSIPSRSFEKVNKNGKEASKTTALVLDGQQRLSSLYQLFYCEFVKPKDRSDTKFFLKINELLKGNIEESIVYYNAEKVKREHLNEKDKQIEEGMLPLNILLFDDKLNDWILSYALFIASQKDKLDKQGIDLIFREIYSEINSGLLFDNKPVNNLKYYKFNVIELSPKTSLETVATIFEKLNTTGAPLDIFEILTAKFHNKISVEINNSIETTMRGLWEKTLELFPSIKSYNDKMKGNALPLLIIKSILLDKGVEIKRKNLLGSRELGSDNSLQADDINKKWLETVKAFDEAIKELKKNYGVPSVDYLPYTTMLAPFSVALNYVRSLPSEKQKEAYRKIERWYWYSVFSQRYDSSTDTKSKSDWEQLKGWIDNNEPMEVMSKTRLNVNDLNLEEVTSSGAIFTGVMNLIFKRKAKDFSTSEPLIDIPVKDIDVHHLYPLKQFATDDEKKKADSLLNKTIMRSETNRIIISDQMPKTYIDYFKNHGNSEILEQIEDHFIPKNEFLSGNLEDFDAFLKNRSKLLKAEIDDLVNK